MIYAVVLAIVVGTLCAVTIIKTRSVKNQADFLVAGRKVAVASAGVYAAVVLDRRGQPFCRRGKCVQERLRGALAGGRRMGWSHRHRADRRTRAAIRAIYRSRSAGGAVQR